MALAKLIIKYEGDARGIAEKRLSLSEFAEALGQLLKAYRRTASNLLAHAEGGDASTGRRHKQVEFLDLEIEAIAGNSVQPVFVATQAPAGAQALLIPDLALQTIQRLLDDIDQEQQGRPRSKVVRDYLDAVPKSVKSQTYTVQLGDKELRRVSFGVPTLVQLPADLPRLLRDSGSVVGVGFPPGEPYVEVTAASRQKPIVCAATPELVESALRLRDKPIEFLSVGGEKSRMLWIRDASDPFVPLDKDDRLAHIHGSWSKTLADLGK